MRFIPFLLYLLLIACHQTLLVRVLSVGPAEIYLAALLVILVGLNKDFLTALWFGWAAGLVLDAPRPDHLGTQMIILSLLAVATVRARELLNLESIKSLVLLLGTGLLIFAIPHTLIYATSGTTKFWRLLLSSVLPSIVYTGFIGWLFFMIQTGRISYQKFKALF